MSPRWPGPRAYHPRPAVTALTAREFDILNRLFLGAASKEAAYALGMTLGSFKQALVRIYRKLDVSSRWGAFRAAGLMDALEAEMVRVAAIRAEARAQLLALADSLA